MGKKNDKDAKKLADYDWFFKLRIVLITKY